MSGCLRALLIFSVTLVYGVGSVSGIEVKHGHTEIQAPSDTSELVHYHDDQPSDQEEQEDHDGTNEISPDGEDENSHEHSHVIVFDTHPTPFATIASPFLISACLAEKLVPIDEQRPEEPSYEFLMPPQLA